MNCFRCGRELEQNRIKENTIRWECPKTDCLKRRQTMVGNFLNKILRK